MCGNEEESCGTGFSGLKRAELASRTAVSRQSNIGQGFHADAEHEIFLLAYELRIGGAWSPLPGGEWVYTLFIFIFVLFYCRVVDTQC